MLSNQQQLDRLETQCLAALAVLIFAALSAAATYATSALAAGLPMLTR